ncbi:L,D-transpeptidase [Calidifontibacter terrae]
MASSSTSRRISTTVVGVLVGFALVVAVVVAFALGRGGHADGAAATGSSAARNIPSSSIPDIPVPTVPPAVWDKLPKADTFGTVRSAPVDRDAFSGGKVVRIDHDLAAFGSPGEDPIAVIPSSQFGPTWLPVIDSDRGWLRVRLPSKPNGSTGWIARDRLQIATTSWAVRISLGKGTMTITKGGAMVGSWTVGKGMANTPTPVGQTFLLGGFVDPDQNFSPVIYAMGAHSDTLDTFGGGPGTVAVHGWPSAAGRSGAVSHGCVRVPGDALTAFAKLPAATPITITS